MKTSATILILAGIILCLIPVIRNWGKVKGSNSVLDGIDEVFFDGIVGAIFHAAKSATRSRKVKIIGGTGFCLIAAGLIWSLN